ncbi:MAG: PcfB family protein [Oscillospiraceae bacterium]|nr:PcfB family protein [Oscillospiraceae bacterium]
MQEELENRSVTLIISGGKLTGRVLKAAVAKYLAWQKSVKQKKEAMQDVKPQGKQSVKQLVGQNQGVANIEITDRNIRSFDYVARKYGVDYAVKKDRSVSPPKYLVFFKARDADALTAAFTEYSRKAVRKAERPSVLAKMRELASQVMVQPADRVRNRDKGLER